MGDKTIFLRKPPATWVVPSNAEKGYKPGPMLLPDGRPNPDWRPFRSAQPSEASQRSALAAIQSLSKYLVNADYLTSSPFLLGALKGTNPNRVREVSQRVLRAQAKDAVDAAIAALPERKLSERLRQLRLRYIFDVFYYLGLRTDEALSGKMGDFYVVRERWWFKTVGKGNKARTVPGPLLRSLSDYRIAMDFTNAYPLPEEDTPIVPRLDGVTAMVDTQARRLLNDLFARAKRILEAQQDAHPDPEVAVAIHALDRATPHWLRHTYATDLFDAGIDPRHVQANLGHSSMDTTLIYSHESDKDRHAHTERIGETMDER